MFVISHVFGGLGVLKRWLVWKVRGWIWGWVGRGCWRTLGVRKLRVRMIGMAGSCYQVV